MEQILQQLEQLRLISGNEQLAKLEEFKSDLLKEILAYTYDTNKKYKIDEGKYNKISSNSTPCNELTLDVWNQFKTILDKLAEKRSAKDTEVELIKALIEANQEATFLKMVLFKDLRLNMNIKKIQKVWPEFLNAPQVQLANSFKGNSFSNNYYSRKLDGVRCYYLDKVPMSRNNKPHKAAPLSHITEQLENILDQFNDWVLDGEIIYLNSDGTEDFKKAISLARSDERNVLCSNLYFVIFDMIPKTEFISKQAYKPFEQEYDTMKTLLKATQERVSWYLTESPNLLIIKQVGDEGLKDLQMNRFQYNWEGLMLRDGDACYEYKRSNKLLKLKQMQDTEVELVGMEEGHGKHENLLGAFITNYKGYSLKIGSGFSDEQRAHYWQNKETYIGKTVKVKYFEETVNQQGGESLRFPVFLCFRDTETMEEYLTLQEEN